METELIRISKQTKIKLQQLGKMGDSFDDVIQRLLIGKKESKEDD